MKGSNNLKEIKPPSENDIKYSKLRKEYLSNHANCEICGGHANQIHHKAKQKGFNRFRFFMAICPNCHTWIHDNSQKSKELGYIIFYDPKKEETEIDSS